MFTVGDVIRFYSDEAEKQKYHLCISFENHFLFLNSPKKQVYPGDFVVPCTDIPCLPATESGNSIISCTLIMRKSEAELSTLKAQKIGSVSMELITRLGRFVRASPVLSDDEKDAFCEAAGDWI